MLDELPGESEQVAQRRKEAAEMLEVGLFLKDKKNKTTNRAKGSNPRSPGRQFAVVTAALRLSDGSHV